MVKHSHSKPS